MVDTTGTLAPHQLDQLRRACGEVITPDDAAYDDARRLWNAVHDRRPAVIVRPTTATRSPRRSASLASTTSRSRSSPAATAPPGSGARDGGLVVDLSAMRGVEVDPRTRIARVERWRAPRRARRRRPGARPRLPGRRRRPHRRRRADPRRRRRPPAAALRADDRQPDGGGARRPPTAASCARPRPTSPSSSGACAAPAGTSGS